MCKKGLKSCAASSSFSSSAPPLLRWKKCPLHGTFARLSGCLNIADEKQTERLDCDTPLLKVQDEVWRAVGEAARTPRCARWLTAQERPGRRSRWGVFPIPGFDSVYLSAALSLVTVSPILACGGLMTQFVWKNCNLRKPHLTRL